MRDFQKELDKFISGNSICLLYFFNDHCAPCRSLRPKLDAMIRDYHPDIPMEKVDASITPRLAGTYDVFAAPVIIIFAEGREYRRYSKYISLDEVRSVIDTLKTLIG